MEMAGLKGVIGTPEYQEALDDILAKIQGQTETRRVIGRRLLAMVCGRGNNQTPLDGQTQSRSKGNTQGVILAAGC